MRRLLACGFLCCSLLTARAEPRWIAVPAGEYRLGAPGHPLNPQRTVKISAYEIADAEVTNAEFAEFVRQTGFKTDAEKRGKAQTFQHGKQEWKWVEVAEAQWRWPLGKAGGIAAEGHLRHPVTQVSQRDAEAYAAWASARLPTQNEWEVAARAGSTTLYPWGDIWDVKRGNIWTGKSHQQDDKADGWEYTAPVRSYVPNAWGLYDVVGNVFEYVADLPPGLQASTKMKQRLGSSRGGSWWCSAGSCRFFNLVSMGTLQRSASLPNQGFRLARTPPKEKK
jgi:formylglycine-generating enzyme